MDLGDRLYTRYMYLIRKRSFAGIGSRCRFYRPLRIYDPSLVSLGGHVSLKGGQIRFMGRPCSTKEDPARVVIGDDVCLDKGFSIFLDFANGSDKARITIGHGCIISENVSIAAGMQVKIGSDVMIAKDALIADYGHDYRDPDQPVAKQKMTEPVPIEIKDGAWLGSRACVFGGVTVGRNSVIGANSVVTSDIPDFCVAGGIPARPISRYDFEAKEWVRVG